MPVFCSAMGQRSMTASASPRKAAACGLFGWLATTRASIVAAALYGVVKRDLRKLSHAEFLSESLSSPLTEWMGRLAAVLTYVVAHVLNQAEHGDFDFSEHLKSLLGIYEGKLAGRRDDHGAR